MRLGPSQIRSSFLFSIEIVALVFLLACLSAAQAPQAPGYWAWMGGSATGNAIAPVYGTEYQFAPGNWPGQRSKPVTWTDETGRLWLFGGERGGKGNCANYLNDLWAFDPKLGAHGEWAWMGGTKFVKCSQQTNVIATGVYGTEYEFADGNLPYGRSSAASWVDSGGRLWLYSGYADGPDGPTGLWSLRDLWVFDPSRGAHGQWAWMGGKNNAAACGSGGCTTTGFHGARGTFAAANLPPWRWDARSWTDKNGRLWLFSGLNATSVGYIFTSYLYDLWAFDPAQGTHGEWAWMGGGINPPYSASPGVYGTEYRFAGSNWPSARSGALGWTDDQGRYWLFGGFGFDAANHFAVMNDLWVFDSTKGTYGMWAWMGGQPIPAEDETGDYVEPSFFGTKYQPSAGSMPGGRYDAFGWKDLKGRFWVYGGWGYNVGYPEYEVDELWMFDPHLGAHGQWAWMGGHNAPYESQHAWVSARSGEYEFTNGHAPGGRRTGMSWTGVDGNLWLLGGDAVWELLLNGSPYLYALSLDDLWEYRFRGAQTITFPKPGAFTYGDAPVTLAATASSSLPVTFSLKSGPATLSGSNKATLTINGGGANVVIVASQAGDADYMPGANVQQSVPVYKHALTVQAEDKTMQYGAPVPALTWSASGFVNGDVAATALTGVPVLTTGATSTWAPGTYAINISLGTLASANYKPFLKAGTLTITPLGTVANPTFSPAAGSYKGTQTVHILDGTAGCTIYYTVDGSTPSPTHGNKYVGSLTVSASETVKAIAVKTGYAPSGVATAAYSIQ